MTDSQWLGLHYIKFATFLKDLDPSGIYAKELDLTITVLVEAPQIDQQFSGISTRQAPITQEPIEAMYGSPLGIVRDFTFDFADPQAVRLSKGEDQELEGPA